MKVKRQVKSSKSLWLNFYVVLQPATSATLLNMNELKGIPHRFLLLVSEYLLCGTAPFQSNPFRLSIRLTSFWNSFFSEQSLLRIVVFQNSYLPYLTDSSEFFPDFSKFFRFQKLFFRAAYLRCLFQTFYFTFVSLNRFSSLNNFYHI